MNFYILDFVVEEVLRNAQSRDQILLKKLTGKRFNRNDAKYLWNRIADHKWYVSERLQRDVGFQVAALDFMENIFQPQMIQKGNLNRSSGFRRILNSLRSFAGMYFVSKLGRSL